MTRKDFWNQVEARVRENQIIVEGGMSAKLAPVMEQVGLHFWMVGASVSLLITVTLWFYAYEALMRVVRVMIWR